MPDKLSNGDLNMINSSKGIRLEFGLDCGLSLGHVLIEPKSSSCNANGLPDSTCGLINIGRAQEMVRQITEEEESQACQKDEGHNCGAEIAGT